VGPGDGFITGGSGTWNLTNGNWTPDFGANNVAWVNNVVPDDAVFGGTGGAVRLGTGITVGSVTFDANGYDIRGNTLTFGSANPTVTANFVFGTITSTVAGSAGLTFEGSGFSGTYFDGSNTYTGITSVNSGFLVVRHANSLGSSVDGTVVASGATLQLENAGGGDVNIANEAVTISGAGVDGNRGALASWTGNNTWGGSVTMVDHSAMFVQSANLSVNGVVSGSGLSLAKIGGGQLTFGGSVSNTYDGVTTVDTGTLVLGKTGGAKAIIGPVQMGNFNTSQPNLRMAANEQFGAGVVMTFVNAPGNWTRFDLQGTAQTLAGLDGATGGGVVQNERLGGGGTAGSGTLTLDNNIGPFFYNGYLRDRDFGAGIWLLNLIKTGAESQTLADGNVAYTGTTTVGQGTLILQQTTNFGSPTTVAAGATLELTEVGNLQNNQVGARIALAGTLNRTGSSGWMVWNGKLSPTAGTATLNLRNDGANPAAGVGWLFLDGGLGATGSQTLTINHTLSDGVTPNNNISTVLRNNNSTYNGSLTVNNGSLVITGGAGVTGTQLANTDVTLNNATLQFGTVFASTQNTGNQLKGVNGTGTVSLGGSALTIGMNNGSGAFSGTVTGAGSVTKVGSGTQTFSGANAYTGATTVNNGTLRLDYATEDNSKLSNTAALTLGGGTLDLSGGSHTEIVGATALAAGTASLLTRSSGNAVLQMNAITRNVGAAISFGASGIATTDTLNNAGGLLGTWATVGGDWAFNSTNGTDGPINAYSAYTQVNRLGGTIADGVASNVKIIEAGAAGGVTLAGAGTTTINSLVQGAAGGAATVDIGAGNTLRLGAAGGILLPSGNPALTFNNGTLTAGGADNTAGSVEVNNGSTSNGITINSLIANNGTGAVTLAKLGAGALTIIAANTHTGGTIVSAGSLAFNSGSLGTTGAITVAGGTLRWNGSNTDDVSARTTLVNGLTATFDTNGNNVTFTSAVGNGTSGAVVKAGNGMLTLSAAATRTGSTTVQGGTLALNNVNALQSSTLDTGTSGSQLVAFTVAGNNTYNLGGLNGADALDIGGNTISVGANNAVTNFSGALSGTGGSLTKVGTGSLTLSGASSNTYTGTSTFASNGQLILSKTGGAVAIPGDFIMAAPGTRGIVSTTEDNQFAPGSVLRFTSAGDTRLELKGTTQTFGGIENSAVVAKTFHAVQHSEFGSPAVVDSTSQVILDVVGTNSFTFNTVNGALRDFNGGVMSLVKNGTGTQTFSGPGTTYTGATAVNNGQLVLFNAPGYASPTTIESGAKLSWSGNADMGNGNTGARMNLKSGAILENLNPANFTVINGAVASTGSTTINHTVNVTAVAGLGFFLDGGLHGTGTVTINAPSAGSGVNLRNNNSTFSGTIIVNGIASTIPFAGSGIGVGGTTVTLQNADITLNGTMELLNHGLGWANGAPGDFAMGALNGPGVMVANFTGSSGETRVRIGNTNNNGSFSGVIADGLSDRLVLTKLGTGTQILSGNNTYSGTTTILGGTLQIGNGGTDGAIGNGAIINNGALVFNRSTASTTAGAISGTGSVTKNGAGVLTLTNNSTYEGPTTINGGTLKLGGSQTLPVSSAIWLDATDGSTINTAGGGVTSWTNKGSLGAAGDTAAAVGEEPAFVPSEAAMNGQPVIHFESAGGVAPFDRLINTQDFTLGNVTVMYVGRLTGGANQRLLAGLSNNWLLGTWNNNSESAFFNNGFLYNAVAPDTVSRIYTGTITTGGAGKFYVNGADRGAVAGSQGPYGLSLGGGYSGDPATEYSSGDIGELLVFTSVLTSDERGAVEAYLARKWQSGDTNILPATGAVALTTAGVALDVNGVTQTIGALTGVAGTSIELNDGSLTVGDATDTSYAGAIVGAGTFTKAGSGELTLSGALSMTTLIADDGTLQVNSNAAGADVIVNATANFGASQTLNSLEIGSGGVATLGSAFPSPAESALAPAPVQAVPEPGSVSLLLFGLVGLLGRPRRARSS
jgi:autotransporter-associated beta strand protein